MQMTSTHKILFLLLFLCASSIGAQVTTVDLKSFNLFGLSDYFIEGKLQAGDLYEFTIYKYTDRLEKTTKGVTFTLRPLTEETFIQNLFTSYATFLTKIKAKDDQLPSAKNLRYNKIPTDSAELASYRKLELEASKLFYRFMTQSIVIEDLGNEPIAGTICYLDSLLILRRDVNDQSLDNRINRLWKVYKQDKKSVNKLQKTGGLNKYLDLKEEVLSADSTLKELMALAKGNKEVEDTISGKFSLLKIQTHLKKRKFRNEKETEFLKYRANDRQNLYEKTLTEVNEKSSEIKVIKDTTTIYSAISINIDSIKSIEKRRQGLYEILKKKHSKVKNQIYDIQDIPITILNEMRSIQLNSEKTKPFNNKDVRNRVENELKPRIIGFKKCIYPDNTVFYFKKERCYRQADDIEKEIKIEKILFEEALLQVKDRIHVIDTTTDQAKKLELKTKRDDLIIDSVTLIKILTLYDNLLVIKGDSLYKNIASYHQTADKIVKLNTIQLDTTNQIELPAYRDPIRLSLAKLNDNPVITSTTVSIPQRLQNRQGPDESDTMIGTLNSLQTKVKAANKKLNKKIDSLKTDRKTKIVDLAEQEDQLIFKGFKVDSIVMEINEGFIENILMVGKVNEYADKYGHLKIGKDEKAVPALRTLKFENSSPIGFSRKLDFDAIKGKKLYTRGGGRTQYETSIEDVLSLYVQEHEVGRRDYSPANQKVVLKKNATGQAALCLGLKKEATYRLFEAKIFSDFVGLDETEPNGLIQTEVSKRINLLTSRKPFHFFSLAGLQNEWNFGFFSYLEPALTLSKIENNNKYLTLESKDRFINNQYTPIKFTSTLKLKQFENFSAGATANLLLLDMPNIKSTFFVNWGFRYGRTGVQDSIRTASEGSVQVNANGVSEYGVNTFDHSPEIMWNIYADERYGFSMSWQHHWFYLRDNRFEQVANTTFYDDQVIDPTKDSRQFNTFRFLMTLEQSNNNKGRLFFRYTYNWQQGFWRTGFHQAQVGYSFFLLGRPQENAAK